MLTDVGELHVRELLEGNPLDMSFAMDVVQHCVSGPDCFSYLDRSFHVTTYDMSTDAR